MKVGQNMKIKLKVLALIISAVMAAGGFFGFRVFTRPELTLYKAGKALKTDGLNAVRPYLIEDACEKLDLIEGLLENGTEEKHGVLSLTKNIGIKLIKDEISKTRFSLNEISVKDDTAAAEIGFDVKGKISGAVTVYLVRETLFTWKISDIDLPRIQSVDLW